MYSKFNDRSRRPTPPRGTPSYRQAVRVPPNYSGHAIVDGEERLSDTVQTPDMLASAPPDASVGHMPDNRDFGHDVPPEPRFDNLDRVSDLPNRDARPLPIVDFTAETPVRSGGLFDLSHFPFGHGIGTEEWLLIGLIFLLLREAGPDRGDLDETVLLLGLLLLGG